MTIPLDPGAGGRSINAEALNMADIIVSTDNNSNISKGIRLVAGSSVSHTMLYVGQQFVVEAIGPGVVWRMLYESLLDTTLAVAYRHPAVDEYTALKICRFAGEQVGKPYSTAGVSVKAGCLLHITGPIECYFMGKTETKYDGFFCSELVWTAYANAGIKLSKTAPHWTTPGEVPALQLKGVLSYVGHLKA